MKAGKPGLDLIAAVTGLKFVLTIRPIPEGLERVTGVLELRDCSEILAASRRDRM